MYNEYSSNAINNVISNAISNAISNTIYNAISNVISNAIIHYENSRDQMDCSHTREMAG